MNSKKTPSSSRSSHRTSTRSRIATPKPARSTVAKAISASSKALATSAIVKAAAPVGQKIVKKMKTKTGLAIAAGVVLAAGLGLARKYRSAQ